MDLFIRRAICWRFVFRNSNEISMNRKEPKVFNVQYTAQRLAVKSRIEIGYKSGGVLSIPVTETKKVRIPVKKVKE
jgi:hypothetical protein